MHTTTHDALVQEWTTLQNNHERHEFSALLIKLVAIIFFAVVMIRLHTATLLPGAFTEILCFVVCVLWVQEATLRTSQSRLATRLLRIEALSRDSGTGENVDARVLQLHSEWQAERAGTLGLLGEYARNALRPTVAFPYALLLAASLLALASGHR